MKLTGMKGMDRDKIFCLTDFKKSLSSLLIIAFAFNCVSYFEIVLITKFNLGIDFCH